MTSTALLTDHYELTMVRAAMRSGTAFRRGVFELFTRRLPAGRRYGVVAGTGRVLKALHDFRFTGDQIEWLLSAGVVDEQLAAYLADYRFSGNIWGYGEGDTYFPGAPLLVVEGTFAEACLLETLLLSIYNYDSAVAAAAARMSSMAQGRPIIEMGARRINESAAVGAARAAYIAGFASTSDLQAGYEWGVPTGGTAAHSFTLLHDTEQDAFAAQLATLGDATTLLVDTYDVESAVRKGIELTRGRLGAVRIDSGDLGIEAIAVRELLDDLGATNTTITVTGDLDEWQIAALRGVPVDTYGVGTSVVTGSGHPTCGMVYKLVSRAESDDPDAELVPVEKKSENKNTVGGRKWALRRRDANHKAVAEVIGVGARPNGDANDRPLMRELVRGGEIVGDEPISAARRRFVEAIAELPPAALRLSAGEPAIPTVILDADGAALDNPYLASISPHNV